MVYARVHDQTVADDYYSAMERVEQRLQIAPPAEAADEDKNGKPLNDDEREQLLDLIGKLVDPDLSCEVRIELVNQMRHVLNHSAAPDKDEAPEQENGRRQRGSPLPSPAFPWVNTV